MIAIVDYDAGNIKSVEKALQYLGEEPVVTRDAGILNRADKVIVPGVGAFGDALGLHLFFQSSEESSGVEGLSLLPGKIVKIPEREGFKIPHMGWNSIRINPESRLFKGIPQDSYVYFVHSYYLRAERPEDVAATTDYVVNIHAAAEHGNVFATQFHPEKSGETGLQILKNFIGL